MSVTAPSAAPVTYLTATEWWRRAREQWMADPPSRRWQDVEAFSTLSRGDQRRIEGRIDAGLRSSDEAVRRLCWKIAEDIAITDWPRL